jgi:hypothetical protein
MQEANRSILQGYVRGAIEHGLANDAGDAERMNVAFEQIVSNLRQLDSMSGGIRDALVPLLAHQNDHVRGWAAAHLLRSHSTQAELILEELVQRGGSAGFDARITLREWRAGRFTPSE